MLKNIYLGGEPEENTTSWLTSFVFSNLSWVSSAKSKHFRSDHWMHQSKSPAYRAWGGYAFEAVCMKHIDQIIEAININAGGIIGSWRFIPKSGVASESGRSD